MMDSVRAVHTFCDVYTNRTRAASSPPPPPRPFGNAMYAAWCTGVQLMYARNTDDKDDDEIQNQSAVSH